MESRRTCEVGIPRRPWHRRFEQPTSQLLLLDNVRKRHEMLILTGNKDNKRRKHRHSVYGFEASFSVYGHGPPRSLFSDELVKRREQRHMLLLGRVEVMTFLQNSFPPLSRT